MKRFTYVIQDPLGIHARPAGLLVKAAKEFAGTEITITKEDKTVKGTQLMKLMGLGVKTGDSVTVTAEGVPPAVPPGRRAICFSRKGELTHEDFTGSGRVQGH